MRPEGTKAPGSYASATRAPAAVGREAFYQVKSHLWAVRNVAGTARGFIDVLRVEEELGARVFERPIEGLDLLEIGTGTMATQALYSAWRANRGTGIDREPQQAGSGVKELLDLA